MAQATAFFVGLATVQATRNPYTSPGARKLFPVRDLLVSAVRSNPTIKSHELIKIIRAMPDSPLSGISEATCKMYMSQARTEFRINSYSF